MKNQPPIISKLPLLLSRSSMAFQKGSCSLLGLMFPWECPACHEVLAFPEVICSTCRNSLPRIIEPFCERCGTPFPSHWTVPVCAECQTARSSLTRVRSVFLYEGVIRDLIRSAKYARRGRSLRFLAEEAYLIAARIFLPKVQAIVPVPMHRSREWHRTYNQAELIAARISNWSGIPLKTILTKRKKTVPQSSLSGEARRKNLRGVIEIRNSATIHHSVLLIDDVITTGTTLQECGKILRRAGAKRVYALTVARAVLNT